MRIAIDVDDALIAEALFTTGLPNVEAVIEEALRDLMAKHRHKRPIIDLAGLGWHSLIASMRGKTTDEDH
jgi:Arc/MetJ family transcription regulator